MASRCRWREKCFGCYDGAASPAKGTSPSNRIKDHSLRPEGIMSLQHSMLSPATFQPFRQRHIAGETYPQRNVAGVKLMG
ncbi:hypothetical protein Tco_1331720 [Tanacetum coccineum]